MNTQNEMTTTTETTPETTPETTETTSAAVTSVRTRWVRPAMDVLEGEGGLLLRVDVPGVGPDDLSLEFEAGRLTMSALRRPDLGYRRVVQVGPDTDPTGIEAEVRDGVLTVSLPRRPELQRRTIEVR